ncbi:hypothetical protein SNOG_12746 [Parastagonospora nodorum SN15]|uniref:F-box domain-containing protein n=1 Tax=Phaeosphaeria nodorum (strain SN15 / ATCC MYA-4574 / FGSC 10173) TaxID=321614 RepID=Q0U668_PHANO|nr:hypothetical protein SNOG_12746 [Parastagonospora nodorum SN15]EAT80044.1 hypothetical protein SNOG_12746 [Parastagonospora nodorum SN15]
MTQSSQDVSSPMEKSFRFLELPPELRNMVYACVVDNLGVDKADKVPDQDVGCLITTSRQVHYEFRSIYWSAAAAKVPLEHLPAFVETFASASHAIKEQMPNVKWELKPAIGQDLSDCCSIDACEELAKIVDLGFINLDGLLSLRYRCSTFPIGGWWEGEWTWQVIVRGRGSQDFEPMRHGIVEFFHKLYLEDPARQKTKVLMINDNGIVTAAYKVFWSGQIGAIAVIQTGLPLNRRLKLD